MYTDFTCNSLIDDFVIVPVSEGHRKSKSVGSRWCKNFFSTSVLIGRIILFPSHIDLRLSIRCTCDVVWGNFGLFAGWTPTVIVQWSELSSRISGNQSDVNYINHISMHTGRTSVNYWVMSKQTLVDYRPISISKGLDRRSFKRYVRMGGRWGWSVETSENFAFQLSLSDHLHDATWESRPSHGDYGCSVVSQSKIAKRGKTHRKYIACLIGENCDYMI